jgi:hypothetical protein
LLPLSVSIPDSSTSLTAGARESIGFHGALGSLKRGGVRSGVPDSESVAATL